MKTVDRELAAKLSIELEAALKESADQWAPSFLQQLERVMGLAKSGTLNEPVKRAPGYRHFIESNLPGDPLISQLYSQWWAAVEGRQWKSE